MEYSLRCEFLLSLSALIFTDASHAATSSSTPHYPLPRLLYAPTYVLTHSLTCSLTHQLNESLKHTHTHTHTHTHSFTHSSTHPPLLLVVGASPRGGREIQQATVVPWHQCARVHWRHAAHQERGEVAMAGMVRDKIVIFSRVMFFWMVIDGAGVVGGK